MAITTNYTVNHCRVHTPQWFQFQATYSYGILVATCVQQSLSQPLSKSTQHSQSQPLSMSVQEFDTDSPLSSKGLMFFQNIHVNDFT